MEPVDLLDQIRHLSPLDALERICLEAEDIGNSTPEDARANSKALLQRSLELLATSDVVLERHNLRPEISRPTIAADSAVTITEIYKYFKNLRNFTLIENSNLLHNIAKERAQKELGYSFYYEFTGDELSRIQELINELRGILVESEIFDEEHRMRLLARLEKLQTEFHKKVPDIDRYLGLFVDAGAALGQFGEQSKPFFDRVREIRKIVQRVYAKAEELPEHDELPLLTADKEDK